MYEITDLKIILCSLRPVSGSVWIDLSIILNPNLRHRFEKLTIKSKLFKEFKPTKHNIAVRFDLRFKFNLCI